MNEKAILPDTHVAADRQARYSWPTIRPVQSVQSIGRWGGDEPCIPEAF